MYKNSYFQGTETPAPHKKKYEVDPTQDHLRNKEDRQVKEPVRVFYKNYDLYDTEGVDGPAKQGPGTGLYQKMDEYKSVSDFRKKKRKKSIRKRQAAILYILSKTDNNKIVTPEDNVNNTNIPYPPAEPAPIGILDGIYPESDLEDMPVGNLYYGILETHFADDPEDKSKNDKKDSSKKKE